MFYACWSCSWCGIIIILWAKNAIGCCNKENRPRTRTHTHTHAYALRGECVQYSYIHMFGIEWLSVLYVCSWNTIMHENPCSNSTLASVPSVKWVGRWCMKTNRHNGHTECVDVPLFSTSSLSSDFSTIPFTHSLYHTHTLYLSYFYLGYSGKKRVKVICTSNHRHSEFGSCHPSSSFTVAMFL